MGEREAGSSSILAGGETQLEGIVIHKNNANSPAPATGSVLLVSEGEKEWIESVVKGGSCKNQQEVIKQRGRWSKIDKVPGMLRGVKENSGCYDPIVISIGPYHHGNAMLELMQQHKHIMACQYVNGNSKLLEELYRKVRSLAKDARECYNDRISVANFNDEKFTQMMVLDACFILEFIYCIVEGKKDDLKMKNNMIALVQRDLFLLENQIPFQVLNELSFKFKNDTTKTMLNKFVTQIRSLPPQSHKKNKKHFLCDVAFGRREGARDEIAGTSDCEAQDVKGIAGAFDCEPAHLLDLIRTNLFDNTILTQRPPRDCSGWFSYRSVKELKEVGIHFRRSKTNKFTDVAFQSGYLAGFLKLPPIHIDDSTKSMLLNMTAYESSPNGPDDFGVSSYICLMDSLIDHAEDVKELRSKGILLNFLGSDQQVADLFNAIADNLVSRPHAYAVVKDDIEKHYKNRLKIWFAEWLHTHFTSPWTVLAFIGAILALVLSVIQTYESLKPSNS